MRKLKPRSPSSLRKYGLTREEWSELLEVGGGRCWICGKGGLTKNLSIDHDHSLERAGVGTRQTVRGLLCQRCNRAIGVWEWSDEVIVRAIDYLRKILTMREAATMLTSDTDNVVPSGRKEKGA